MALIVVLHGIGSSTAQGTSGLGRRGRCRPGSAVLMVGQGLSGKIVANRGQFGDAEQLVCSVAERAIQTGLLSERADTPLELSHVLAAVAKVSEARSAVAQELGLYERKRNMTGARESLRYPPQSAPA